jgi:hypothetical protein
VPKGQPLLERFWSKVDVRDPDECWEWQAARVRQGYGRFWIGGHEGWNIRAHRFAYELVIGEIPWGLDVCHSCDNPPCVNPAHLWVGTKKDNALDMVRKGRAWKPTWAGEGAPGAKLTWEQVREIRALAKTTGLTRRELGALYGVAGNTVSMIVHGQIWKELSSQI